jgi:hypothetical protein
MTNLSIRGLKLRDVKVALDVHFNVCSVVRPQQHSTPVSTPVNAQHGTHARQHERCHGQAQRRAYRVATKAAAQRNESTMACKQMDATQLLTVVDAHEEREVLLQKLLRGLARLEAAHRRQVLDRDTYASSNQPRMRQRCAMQLSLAHGASELTAIKTRRVREHQQAGAALI